MKEFKPAAPAKAKNGRSGSWKQSRADPQQVLPGAK
jgi:hypothetical protein